MVENTASIRFFLIAAGHCTHSEHVVLTGGRREPICFPSLVGVMVHPQHGVALFDAGYSPRFLTHCERFPYSLYARVTPVTLAPEQTAVAQLQALGLRAEEVKTIFISHFHADHIAGIQDFPHARFVCARDGYDSVRGKRGFRALVRAFLPDLLPDDFEARARYVDDFSQRDLPATLYPFEKGYDVFGDGSALVVSLPGHADGHVGLFLPGADQPTFLVGDASWLARSYRDHVQPSPLATLVFSDRRAYRETLGRLHAMHKRQSGVRIIPSHCLETFEELPEALRSGMLV